MCNHLTVFSVGGVLPVNTISSDDILNFFNWSNIRDHPLVLIVLSSVLLFWIIMAIIFHFQLIDCGKCFDRSKFPVGETPQSKFTREAITPLLKLQSQGQAFAILESMSNKNVLQWLIQPAIFSQVKKYTIIILLSLHPWLGIIFYNPADNFKNIHRLAILVTALFSFLCSNAIFYGTTSNLSFESQILVSIVSSLIVIPVQLLLRYLFLKSLTLKTIIVSSAESFHSSEISIELAETKSHSKAENSIELGEILKKQKMKKNVKLGNRLLILSWFLCFVWNSGMIFLSLVYGMQFDLASTSSSSSSTSSQWLQSSFTSTGLDFFINAPITAFIQAALLVFFSRKAITSLDLKHDVELDNRIITTTEATVIMNWLTRESKAVSLIDDSQSFLSHYKILSKQCVSILESFFDKLSLKYPSVHSQTVSSKPEYIEFSKLLSNYISLLNECDLYFPLLQNLGNIYHMDDFVLDPMSFNALFFCTLFDMIGLEPNAEVIYCWMWILELFSRVINKADMLPSIFDQVSMIDRSDKVLCRVQLISSTCDNLVKTLNKSLKTFLHVFENSYDQETGLSHSFDGRKLFSCIRFITLFCSLFS